VITFKNHPLSTLTNQKIELILDLDEKLEMFENIGIDNVVLLDFEKISHLKANDYLENILVKYFSPISITTGFNHNFGYNKEGNSEFLRKNKDKYGYKYFEIPPFVVDDKVVSCSVIKNLLHLGNFYEANKLLGYSYFIQGRVIEGDKIASKLGFASANIVYPMSKPEIPHGVYFVTVEIDGNTYNGVLNHGYAPTIDNTTKLKTEVHIINFNQNLYDKKIKIKFITKIRNQMKFDNIDKLKAQIQRDIAFTDIFQHFLSKYF
jgi:riboflavin kinase/FMN adenylyltransferase